MAGVHLLHEVFSLLSLCFLISLPSIRCQTVELPLGKVNGLACPLGVGAIQYLGIPFALSPLGNLRFRPPLPYNISYPEDGYDATKYPRRCGSPCDSTMVNNERITVGEDCLFMNIWVPSVQSDTPFPVRLYIHGGMNKACNANDAHIAGCNVAAATASIIINIQYRLGVPGFLAHPLTLLESNTTGNWGVLDQQLAMRWVKDHVQYFGGDPEKILLHGGSSGGTQVALQLTLTDNAGLFSSAIAQSATCLTMLTLLEAYEVAADFSATAGCNFTDPAEELECLRSLSMRDITGSTNNYTGANCFSKDSLAFGPVMDDFVIQQQIMEAFISGSFINVPFMIGVNEKEGSFFMDMFVENKWNITDDEMDEVIEELFPLVEPHYVLDLYPAVNYESKINPNYERLVDILTDVNIACTAFSMMFALQLHNTSLYAYFFKHGPSCPLDEVYRGATHGTELTFVYGNTINVTPPTGTCNYTLRESYLADEMMYAWTAMANTGVPSFLNGTQFPKWDLGSMTNTILDLESVFHTVDVTNRCIAINKYHQGVVNETISMRTQKTRKSAYFR